MVKKTITKPEPEYPEFVIKLSGSNSQIRVSLTNFKGAEYVDIRKYYETKDGDWKPTPKGVPIPLADFNKVYAKLRRMKLLLTEE